MSSLCSPACHVDQVASDSEMHSICFWSAMTEDLCHHAQLKANLEFALAVTSAELHVDCRRTE